MRAFLFMLALLAIGATSAQGQSVAPNVTPASDSSNKIANTRFVHSAIGAIPAPASLTTAGNCASGASPAVCGSASSGSVAVPTGANPTLVVDTSAVTANSIILLTPDESLGTKLSVTCNSTITTQGPDVVTARSPGVSFTVEVDATVGTNPVCLNYVVIN